jgi:Zn-dependent metalloprotease
MPIKTMLPLTHIGEQKTYDIFSVHGRNSYDNLGAAIKVTFIMTLHDNAYWNGSVMTYGDGS